MTVSLATSVRNAQVDAIGTALGTSATIKFYTGSKPATPATAVTGTLLATCALTTPNPVGAGSSGVATFAAITNDSSIDATGTVGYFRCATSGGTGIMDGTVTATGGGGDITTPSTSWVATEPLAVSSLTITAGNA